MNNHVTILTGRHRGRIGTLAGGDLAEHRRKLGASGVVTVTLKNGDTARVKLSDLDVAVLAGKRFL